MLKLIFGFSFLLLSACVFGQVIDAETYIKQNGFQKKAAAGFGIFYTTIKRVRADEMPPFIEAVKTMPRTEDALNMCQQQAIGAQKQFDSEGRQDLRIQKSVGYGGPQDEKFGCIFFIESQSKIAATQVYFLKIVLRGDTYDAYTVIVSH
ncbi:hypothetical protein R2103_12180 [Nitrosomonas sp. Is24]|uniref:hypothetical protein n=1 Tax=Nitrosomonas sp. Is24 TaxID=3080533 RepID=UPI00294B0945|nr:hypothetical protein [Nitrosomonas sp. Is24]MDV6342523.1 hypothetical protein [Nitrosomonas sp. Is24]